MLALEDLLIANMRVARLERTAGEFLVRVRIPVLQRPVGFNDRGRGEGIGEDNRDLCPLLVFFVPAIGIAHVFRDLLIALRRKLDTAMAGRGNALDAFGEFRDVLRSAPGRECDLLVRRSKQFREHGTSSFYGWTTADDSGGSARERSRFGRRYLRCDRRSLNQIRERRSEQTLGACGRRGFSWLPLSLKAGIERLVGKTGYDSPRRLRLPGR